MATHRADLVAAIRSAVGARRGRRSPRRHPTSAVDYEVSLESLSQWQIAWRKFRKHRLALVGLGHAARADRACAVIGPLLHAVRLHDVPNPDEIVCAGRPPSLAAPLRRDRRPAARRAAAGRQRRPDCRCSSGFISMFIGVILGTIVGAIAGYFGGFADNVLMRIVDVFLSPAAAVRDPRRQPVLRQRQPAAHRPHLRPVQLDGRVPPRAQPVPVPAGTGLRGGGARRRRPERRIIFRHILPNAVSPIVVVASLTVAGNIIGEAFVSFLGFGVSTHHADLGQHPEQRARRSSPRATGGGRSSRASPSSLDGARRQLHR